MENARPGSINISDADTCASIPFIIEICDLFAIGRPYRDDVPNPVVAFVGEIPALSSLEIVYTQIAFVPIDIGDIPSVRGDLYSTGTRRLCPYTASDHSG
jgi:hypothetical protein